MKGKLIIYALVMSLGVGMFISGNANAREGGDIHKTEKAVSEVKVDQCSLITRLYDQCMTGCGNALVVCMDVCIQRPPPNIIAPDCAEDCYSAYEKCTDGCYCNILKGKDCPFHGIPADFLEMMEEFGMAPSWVPDCRGDIKLPSVPVTPGP